MRCVVKKDEAGKKVVVEERKRKRSASSSGHAQAAAAAKAKADGVKRVVYVSTSGTVAVSVATQWQRALRLGSSMSTAARAAGPLVSGRRPRRP